MEAAQKGLNQFWNKNTSILGLAYKVKFKTRPQLQMTKVRKHSEDLSTGLVLFYLLSLSPHLIILCEQLVCVHSRKKFMGLWTWKHLPLCYAWGHSPISRKIAWRIVKLYQFLMYRPRKFLLYIQLSAIWILFVCLNNQWERRIFNSSGCHL